MARYGGYAVTSYGSFWGLFLVFLADAVWLCSAPASRLHEHVLLQRSMCCVHVYVCAGPYMMGVPCLSAKGRSVFLDACTHACASASI